MEELKKDVESVKVLTAHKTFLENVSDMGILKKKNIHESTAAMMQPGSPEWKVDPLRAKKENRLCTLPRVEKTTKPIYKQFVGQEISRNVNWFFDFLWKKKKMKTIKFLDQPHSPTHTHAHESEIPITYEIDKWEKGF